MTKQEILNQIEELKKQVEALDKPKTSVPWKPDINETYYSVSPEGWLEFHEWVSYDDEDNTSDRCRYRNGNVFKTREQAEKFAKKRAARNRLELIAAELNEGWEPDWENSSLKYYIEGNVESKYFVTHFNTYQKGEKVYFKSRELAERAHAYLTEEEKLSLWGVK